MKTFLAFVVIVWFDTLQDRYLAYPLEVREGDQRTWKPGYRENHWVDGPFSDYDQALVAAEHFEYLYN